MASLPLNDYHVKKTNLLINRVHFFLHGTALLSLFYYRITNLTAIISQTRNKITLLPHVLILISELILCFIWVLGQPSKWRPVIRTVYPDRLPRDDNLPSIDVFICTADPNKEPCLEVMNTVISALALDYPPRKLHVYLSDDGGSHLTFRAMKQAWEFSRLWVPFCRRYQVRNTCPEAYFSREEIDDDMHGELILLERKHIQTRYEEFKNCLAKIVAETNTCASRDHPSLIEVISDANNGEGSDTEMPNLVYLAREKRPSHPHHFKAGALNVLLRVSSMMSNAPYILVLDCDMYCNDPTSARQAMCFHLDSKLSPKLAFVQFPQKFHNISETDIYDCQLRFVWPKWEGLDGLRGPILSGSGFYIKRKALYGPPKSQEDVDLVQLRMRFGSSDELIKSVYRNYKPNYPNNQDTNFSDNTLQEELQLLASCTYDNGKKWGKEASGIQILCSGGRLFHRLEFALRGLDFGLLRTLEALFLGVVSDESRRVFDSHTRWNVGLSQIALSRFSPLLYGPMRMPISQSMCYAEFAYTPLYFLTLYILALVPQLCFLQGIPLYPHVSSPFFFVFLFVFVSAQVKHVEEVYSSGSSIQAWSTEQRIWMMKSLTCYVYAMVEVVMEKVGVRRASFLPTNKVVDEEQAKRYEIGVYDFQAAALFMVPLCTVYVVNVGCLVIGIGRIILGSGKGMREMVIQGLIPLFGVVLNYHLVEGMVLRKDKGRVSASVSLVSALLSVIILSCVSIV